MTYDNDQQAATLWYHDHAVADGHFGARKGIALEGRIIKLTVARKRSVLDRHSEVVVSAWQDPSVHKVQSVLVLESH